jgi:hypothetical protein
LPDLINRGAAQKIPNLDSSWIVSQLEQLWTVSEFRDLAILVDRLGYVLLMGLIRRSIMHCAKLSVVRQILLRLPIFARCKIDRPSLVQIEARQSRNPQCKQEHNQSNNQVERSPLDKVKDLNIARYRTDQQDTTY